MIYVMFDASSESGQFDDLPHCKKQIDVTFPRVCPVIDTKFRYNIVKVVCYFLDNVIMKFMINKKTDA